MIKRVFVAAGMACTVFALQNLNAQARLLHHPPDAANLTFDPIQSRDNGLLLGSSQHRSS